MSIHTVRTTLATVASRCSRTVVLVTVAGLGLATVVVAARGADASEQLAEPFRGVTTNGTIIPGVFSLRATGVPMTAVREAAQGFLAALTPEQKAASTFPLDSEEWRDWQNIHRYARKGIDFGSMTPAQRERAFALLTASLSAQGVRKTRDIMRLNQTIAELTKRFEEYGEGRYHLTFMGEPSPTTPWGWQLDGHHLVVNYVVIGDQIVMTPTFMGSEPVMAEDGQYKGTIVLQDEQNKGLALMTALSAAQRTTATIAPAKTANNALGQAFRDNLVVDYAGIKATALDAKQRALLVDVIAEYVNNMPPGHAAIRMDDVRRRLDDTYFAWIGEVGPESVFYYRIQSPVVLIEFDHQTPVALPGDKVPTRRHVHSVIRTPNGNDYGKDLLRQHYEATRSNPAHGH